MTDKCLIPLHFKSPHLKSSGKRDTQIIPLRKPFSLQHGSGFTLVELVIILILLSIISAVAIPRFLDLITPSKENVTRHRLTELKKAIAGDPDTIVAGTYSARGFRGDTGQWPEKRGSGL